MERMIVGGLGFWCLVGSVVGIAFSIANVPLSIGEGIVGYLSLVCSLGYYASPLTTMRQVIASKDSSSLYIPTIAANMTNALMWVSEWAPDPIPVHNTISISLSTLDHLRTLRYSRPCAVDPQHDRIRAWMQSDTVGCHLLEEERVQQRSRESGAENISRLCWRGPQDIVRQEKVVSDRSDTT